VVGMKIKGIETLSPDQLRHEIERGGRFVIFQYCISIVVLTFKRVSDIHFIKGEESVFRKGAAYSVISLLCGWWGIPWGPIWTVSALITNCRGGRDVTADVVRALSSKAA
jgi:hypothetical protein